MAGDILDYQVKKYLSCLSDKYSKCIGKSDKNTFKIIASDGIIYTRRNILNKCNHFASLFKHEFAESKTNEYKCDDFDMQSIKYLIWICVANCVIYDTESIKIFKQNYSSGVHYDEDGHIVIDNDNDDKSIYDKLEFDDILKRINVIKYFFLNCDILKEQIDKLLFETINQKSLDYFYDAEFIQALIDNDICIEKSPRIMDAIHASIQQDNYQSYKTILSNEHIRHIVYCMAQECYYGNKIDPVILTHLIEMKLPLDGIFKLTEQMFYLDSTVLITNHIVTKDFAWEIIRDIEKFNKLENINYQLIIYIVDTYPTLITLNFVKHLISRSRFILNSDMNKQIVPIVNLFNNIKEKKLGKNKQSNIRNAINRFFVEFFMKKYPYHIARIFYFYEFTDELVRIINITSRDEKQTELDKLYKNIFVNSFLNPTGKMFIPTNETRWNWGHCGHYSVKEMDSSNIIDGCKKIIKEDKFTNSTDFYDRLYQCDLSLHKYIYRAHQYNHPNNWINNEYAHNLYLGE